MATKLLSDYLTTPVVSVVITKEKQTILNAVLNFNANNIGAILDDMVYSATYGITTKPIEISELVATANLVGKYHSPCNDSVGYSIKMLGGLVVMITIYDKDNKNQKRLNKSSDKVKF